ncbi:NUDIX domain-containing protein [Krasilnikovia sp. MM14-A1259]|uniref:NUDIX domain-containing protein n=1 Tax=Krasilnikovia sp. MM14-A1259 TaxID=3373539 RepID=UPI003814A85E
MAPPGGHVDPNEAPAEAAVREVAEEAGIHARVLHPPLFTHPAVTSHPTPWAIIEMDVEDRRHGPHRHIDLVYVCRATGGQLTAQLAEVGDARWVALGDVAALPIPGELPELIDAALRWAKEYA